MADSFKCYPLDDRGSNSIRDVEMFFFRRQNGSALNGWQFIQVMCDTELTSL